MNKRLIKLAIPNIISNITVPLLGAVDTAIIGRLEGVYYLGAIAVGSLIFDFLFWGFGFLRMGTTGLVAQAYGANKKREALVLLYRVMLVALIIGALMLIFQVPILETGLYFINASPEVEQYARKYFYIRIISAPATLCLFSLNGWFMGMQNAKYPMYITVFMNIVNIIANLLLVYGVGMKVEGVAWGSVLATYLSIFLGYILYKRKYSFESFKISKAELFVTKELKKFFVVNGDIFIRTMCIVFTYAFFTAKSAQMGDTWLAANTILLQLFYISTYAIDGFAFAAESIVGMYSGAKQPHKLKKAINLSMFWGLAFAVFGTLVYAVYHAELISIFTNNIDVKNAAGTVIVWLIFAPLISSIGFIWDGVYIGATETTAMRNSMLIAVVLFFVPVYYLVLPKYPSHAIWAAMMGFMFARGLVLTAFAPKTFYQKLKV